MKSRIDLRLPDESFRMAAESQKTMFRRIAAAIESGDALESRTDRKLAAGAIRAFADSIPLAQKGRQGPAPKFCAGAEAMSYAAARMNPMAPRSHGEALAEIADRVGVSEQAIEKAIKPHRAAAFGLFDVADPGNKRNAGNQ